MMIGRAPSLRQNLRHLQPAQARHLDVEEDQLGGLLSVGLQGGRPVARLSDDLHVAVLGQQCAQALPNQRLVVDDQASDHDRPS